LVRLRLGLVQTQLRGFRRLKLLHKSCSSEAGSAIAVAGAAVPIAGSSRYTAMALTIRPSLNNPQKVNRADYKHGVRGMSLAHATIRQPWAGVATMVAYQEIDDHLCIAASTKSNDLMRRGSSVGRLTIGSCSWPTACLVRLTSMTYNYALERSVRPCGWRAAGARRHFTPAARCKGLARPAQRGRWASL
jgi:hypothetical protein